MTCETVRAVHYVRSSYASTRCLHDVLVVLVKGITSDGCDGSVRLNGKAGREFFKEIRECSRNYVVRRTNSGRKTQATVDPV